MTPSSIMLKGSVFQVMPVDVLSSNSTECDDGVVIEKKDAGPASCKFQNGSNRIAVMNGKTTPPKIEKPRPHMCGICQRGFARLEHLKRHERSHTKEKPFECPECSRCFARRDLLLRHQQKLHTTTLTSTKPRNRRETVAGTTVSGTNSGRVRKNSLASGRGATLGRPRANTISHMEGANAQLMAAADPTATTRQGVTRAHNRHTSISTLPLQQEYNQLGGVSSSMDQRANTICLPRLETHNFPGTDYGGGIRTAPLLGRFNYEFECDGFMLAPNLTVNPNALHYSDVHHPMIFDAPSPYLQNLVNMNMNTQQAEENFDWMSGFDHQVSLQDSAEHVFDSSSPAATEWQGNRMMNFVNDGFLA